MSQQPETSGHQREQKRHQKQHIESVEELDETEGIECHPAPRRTLYDKVCDKAERFAATWIGQFTLERVDRMLQMVESTAKWSLPTEQNDCKLERQLSWIPFLILIVVLRLIRMWTSVALLLIGNGPVTAHDMVYFVQTRRRKLRAIRSNGLKAIQADTEAKQKESGSTCMMGRILSLLSCAVCRPSSHDEVARCIFVGNKLTQKTIPKIRQTVKRPRDDDNCDGNDNGDADENLTVNEMLEKYAVENSDDDSDFVPNQDDESDDIDSSTSCASSISNEELTEGKPHKDDDSCKKNTENGDRNANEDDNSVDIVKNGNDNAMPQPLVEVKTETPSSDVESGNDQLLKENGPISSHSHSDDNLEPNVKCSTNVTANAIYHHPTIDHFHGNLNANSNKSSPNRIEVENTATLQPFRKIQAPTFGTTATADLPLNNADIIHKSPSNCNTCSSSSSSSYTSLASLVANDDTISNETSSEPSTPTPTSANIESPALITASSSEDIFYSPIGSPADFNAFFQPVSILKNPIEPSAQRHGPTREPTITDTASISSNLHRKPHQQPNPAQRQHPQNQNRYRGRNRR